MILIDDMKRLLRHEIHNLAYKV